MLRLRTTTALSVLALGVGIAGTLALSAQTPRWSGPPSRMAQAGAPARSPGAGHAAARPARLVATHVPHLRRAAPPVLPWHAVARRAVASTPAAAELPVLQPLSMPNTNAPFEQRRNHLIGSLVLRLDIDGEGRVLDVATSQSSGDEILDAYALHMVRDWRFAVPAGHPRGLRGELPMRFDSVDRLAGVR